MKPTRPTRHQYAPAALVNTNTTQRTWTKRNQKEWSMKYIKVFETSQYQRTTDNSERVEYEAVEFERQLPGYKCCEQTSAFFPFYAFVGTKPCQLVSY